MKRSIVFGIKANVASILLSLLITMVVGVLLRSFFENVLTAGVLSVCIAFVAMYISLQILLKNSQGLVGAERKQSLEMTWKIAASIGGILLVLDSTMLLARGVAWTIFAVLSVVASCLAVFVVAKR